MNSDSTKLGELKTKLFRLHFLLTEEQTEQALADGVEQFRICYESAMDSLSDYIQNEYNRTPKSYDESLNLALEHRLFNAEMIDSMRKMNTDYTMAKRGHKIEHIYSAVQGKYARFLQMIYDMLIQMGEEAEEEK